MKQRLTYIDALRGFAIFLVALGHVTDLCGYTYSFLCGFIYSFHMPLFMAIAGFVCAYSATDTLCVEGKGGFWKFIWKKNKLCPRNGTRLMAIVRRLTRATPRR